MKKIAPETPVGEIVRAFPARSRVFENLGIDYCCGGKKPLAEACKAKGLDPTTVAAMLSALDNGRKEVQTDPDTLSLTELCDHIERVHHGYLREELPRLDFMTRKVAATHGDAEPRLLDVRRAFEVVSEKVSAHTAEEDAHVFPAIRQFEAEEGGKAIMVSQLQTEFAKLESEHQNTGAALVQFRELTGNYTPPDWACNTWRALYDGLRQMEREMHQHIHEENNFLFPRALALA
jgi:regulator of cell morphogenesis and NO signaling